MTNAYYADDTGPIAKRRYQPSRGANFRKPADYIYADIESIRFRHLNLHSELREFSAIIYIRETLR
jgi:hypothetical protein